MALGSNRDETARIWEEDFPGFGAHNSVNRAKPGAVRVPFPPGSPDAIVTLKRSLPGEDAVPVKLVRDEVSRTWHAAITMDTEGAWIFTARMPRAELDPLFARALLNVIPDIQSPIISTLDMPYRVVQINDEIVRARSMSWFPDMQHRNS